MYVISDRKTNAAGKTEKLDSTGPVLGLLTDTVVTRSPARRLQPGDIVLLPTDGIEETISPRRTFFDIERTLTQH